MQQGVDAVNEFINKLSVMMRAQKCVDHIEHGKCGPSSLKHDRLDEWITKAEALELQVEMLTEAIETRHKVENILSGDDDVCCRHNWPAATCTVCAAECALADAHKRINELEAEVAAQAEQLEFWDEQQRLSNER
jgi:hypothetical protein